jgi:hypothetical protein
MTDKSVTDIELAFASGEISGGKVFTKMKRIIQKQEQDHTKAMEAQKWNAKGNLHALECANNDLKIEAGKAKKLRQTIQAQAKQIESLKAQIKSNDEYIDTMRHSR